MLAHITILLDIVVQTRSLKVLVQSLAPAVKSRAVGIIEHRDAVDTERDVPSCKDQGVVIMMIRKFELLGPPSMLERGLSRTFRSCLRMTMSA